MTPLSATFAGLCVSGALAVGCAARGSAPEAPGLAPRETSRRVQLYGRDLTLHFATTPGARDPLAPLVLYASGDGGWFGTAIGMFRSVASDGFDVVGFSSRAFMQIVQSGSSTTTPEHVVAAYGLILEAARHELGLPMTTPVVLTGWSRGASIGVLVAGNLHVDPHVRGVVAIGLAARDHLDVAGDTDDDRADAVGPALAGGPLRDGEIDMYARIAHIAPRRSVVIQASQDGYLPAEGARTLFGVDSNVKHLVTVTARNHRFHGGELAFVDALRDAVRWVAAADGGPPASKVSRDPGREAQ